MKRPSAMKLLILWNIVLTALVIVLFVTINGMQPTLQHLDTTAWENRMRILDNEKMIDGHRDEIDDLTEEASQLKKELDNLDWNVDMLKIDVDSLNWDVYDLKLDVDSLNWDVYNLKLDVDSLSWDVYNLKLDVKRLEYAR